ncbi:MAG: NAD+ synthase [Candidatus Marinimicrobia bacterium]|nr:NAD+ synthase [Candidatus Neomarinimicrobiota bacterium]
MLPKFTLAQINPTVGALRENANRIISIIDQNDGESIVVFPELSVLGYPPQDLLNDSEFIQFALEENQRIIQYTEGKFAIFGSILQERNVLFNVAIIAQNGRQIATIKKRLLPRYDVFNERRYFEAGKTANPVSINWSGEQIRLGIEICEDLWDDDYNFKVTEELIQNGAEIIINVSASPFYTGKSSRRIQLARRKSLKTPLVYCNLIGGQDELIFDGNSFAINEKGKLVAQLNSFEEELKEIKLTSEITEELTLEKPEDNFRAISLGIRDYFRKSGLEKAVIGLSGGIDSAVVAVIAVDALGKDNVTGITMPSRFSSQHSIDDAKQLAENLEISFLHEPIDEIFQQYLGKIKIFRKPFDTTEENIQARIRGNLLMAWANKNHAMVISTGNKTELALGYCTLYGDMSGGLAAISDLNKIEVYEIARWFNKFRGAEIIPKSTVEKIPSAELAENQIDPYDYEVVSPLVDLLITGHFSDKALVEMGYDLSSVRELKRQIQIFEYKRKQAAPGIRVSPKAFGIGRRMPIVNRFIRTKKGE